MKKCTKCQTEKEINQFSWKVLNVRKSTWCKSCVKEVTSKHYQDNKTDYYKYSQKRKEDFNKKVLPLIYQHLSEHPCVCCNENDIVTLDYDYIDPSEKHFTISSMIRRRYKWDTIKQEIDKCQVLCSNCHRKRTAKQFGNRKLEFISKNLGLS